MADEMSGLVAWIGLECPLVVGAAFAIAWTPCVGPTLTAILGLASTTGSVWRGGLMLAVYSLGLAIPFLLTALAFSRMTSVFGVVKRNYRAIMAFGKFQGVIAAATPIGCLMTVNRLSGWWPGMVSP